MRTAIGFDPLSGLQIPTSCRFPTSVLLVDVVWWLLETALAVDLIWRSVRPRPVWFRAWLAAVWVLTSAARFLPVLALTRF